MVGIKKDLELVLTNGDTINSLTNDLQLNFGGKKQYKSMQRDLNKFIKEHDLTKKWDIEIMELKSGKDYLVLPSYKAMQARCREKAKKMVENYVSKKMNEKVILGVNFTDLTKVVDVLKDKLEEFYYRDLVNKNAPDNTDMLINKLTKTINFKDKKINDLKYDIRVKNNDIRNLEERNNKLKDKLNKKIDKDALDKHVQQLVDNKLIDYKKEISSKESKIKELNEDLTTKTNELNAYKKAYNNYREYEVDVKEFVKEYGLVDEFTKFMKRDNDYNLNR